MRSGLSSGNDDSSTRVATALLNIVVKQSFLDVDVYSRHRRNGCDHILDLLHVVRRSALTVCEWPDILQRLNAEMGVGPPRIEHPARGSLPRPPETLLRRRNDVPYERSRCSCAFCTECHDCYDRWEQWVPELPAQAFLKDAVDHMRENY